MNAPETPFAVLTDAARQTWQRFLDSYEPLRPDLYRYCGSLTRSPWEAEDLAQDALARAFAALAKWHHPPPSSPRAWLFRVASNLWIDRVRARRELQVPARDQATPAPEPQATREAAGTLISRLSPQERAAVVLKDAFDFTLEEIAEVLVTTTGGVKAALHRGRGKLAAEEEPPPERTPTPAVLDAFVNAFNAHDLERLISLLVEDATLQVVGATDEYGKDAVRAGPLQGMVFGTRRVVDPASREFLDLEAHDRMLPDSPRAELRLHRGEPLVVLWYHHTDGEFVRGFVRLHLDGARIARVENHFYGPEVLREVCAELGVPCRTNGYRYWRRDAPGS